MQGGSGNGGAHKIYNATVHCLTPKKQEKNILLRTGAVMQEKSTTAKNFGLSAKFLGLKI